MQAATLLLKARVQLALSDNFGARSTLLEASMAAADARAYTLVVETWLELVSLLGNRLSQLPEAKVWAQAVQVQAEQVALDDPGRAELHSTLAGLAVQQGDYPKALALYERALALDEKAFGREHPRVEERLALVADVMRRMGRHDEALTRLDRAKHIVEQAYGREHPEVGSVLSDMAAVHQNRGEYEVARRELEEAVDISEKTLGRVHGTTAITIDNLGNLLTRMRQPEEAFKLHQEALAIQEKVFGPQSVLVSGTLTNVATDLLHQGKLDEAEPLFRRALELREKLLGPSHPELAPTLTNLAALLAARERFADSVSLHQRALALREQSSPTQPGRAFNLLGLGQSFIGLRRFPEAVQALERGLEAGKGGFPQEFLAEGHFLLAQALWGEGGRDNRRRALAEGREAQSLYGTHPAASEVEAWLEAPR
jgi:tetratricopeptide (TPR) repeat protein